MNNAYNYPTTATGAACPNCGYCSHCGRGGITPQSWCGGFPQTQCGGGVVGGSTGNSVVAGSGLLNNNQK